MHPRVEVFFTFKNSAHIKLLNNTYRAVILSDNSHFSLAAATVLHVCELHSYQTRANRQWKPTVVR